MHNVLLSFRIHLRQHSRRHTQPSTRLSLCFRASLIYFTGCVLLYWNRLLARSAPLIFTGIRRVFQTKGYIGPDKLPPAKPGFPFLSCSKTVGRGVLELPCRNMIHTNPAEMQTLAKLCHCRTRTLISLFSSPFLNRDLSSKWKERPARAAGTFGIVTLHQEHPAADRISHQRFY